jgi:hypothetical protein
VPNLNKPFFFLFISCTSVEELKIKTKQNKK